MKRRRLSRNFFARRTLTVARELLGKFLVRRIGNRKIAAMITETEAYVGPADLASHAWRGRTQRTEVMFGPPGHAYVYFIYGMYHCLNIVTEKDGYPAAVLIRGAVPDISGADLKKRTVILPRSWQDNSMPLDGPGKLCRFLKIDKRLNKEDLTQSKKLWLEDRGVKLKSNQIKKAKRIGVDYAGKYKDKLWRFVIESA